MQVYLFCLHTDTLWVPHFISYISHRHTVTTIQALCNLVSPRHTVSISYISQTLWVPYKLYSGLFHTDILWVLCVLFDIASNGLSANILLHSSYNVTEDDIKFPAGILIGVTFLSSIKDSHLLEDQSQRLLFLYLSFVANLCTSAHHLLLLFYLQFLLYLQCHMGRILFYLVSIIFLHILLVIPEIFFSILYYLGDIQTLCLWNDISTSLRILLLLGFLWLLLSM